MKKYLSAILMSVNLIAFANEADYTLDVSQHTKAPDGRQREVWLYNGQLPGPVIRAKKGERLKIHVTNHLDIPTSVHWHGMYQRGTWQMDGVTGVSHLPIPPKESFTYEFTAFPGGTHWYHSHTGIQYSEGLIGPLIVEDPEDKKRWSYDREEILIFNDWFVERSEEIYNQLTHPPKQMKMAKGEKRDIGDYPFESVLINGKGRFNAKDNTPLAKFTVKQGETVRFRLINASSTYALNVTFDNHPVTVVAADGQPIKPVTVDVIPMAIGERYDVLLKADQTGSHWIRVDDDNGKGGKALLVYEGANTQPKDDIATANLKTLKPEDILSPADVTIANPEKEVHLTLGGQMVPYQWKINGKMFPNTDKIEVKKGEHVRLLIENPTGMAHPFHIHGHSVYFLGDKEHMNLKNPPRRDQIVVPANGSAVVQLYADNPGKWFFHCHIEWHLAAGMATVVEYKPL